MSKAATVVLVVVVQHKTQVVVVVRHWGAVAVLSRTAVTTGLRQRGMAQAVAGQVPPQVVPAAAAALVVMLKN
jgi:hypothetical protein